MNAIKKEFNKLSKQGKINVRFHLVTLMIVSIMILMGLTILSLEFTILNQQNQIEHLQEKVSRIEQIQNNLITHINRVGG